MTTSFDHSRLHHRPTFIGLFALLTGLACGAVPAQAQSMDYGLLQHLFKGPVTTSATGTPQRVTDVPVNMIIVTADEIRRSGARDVPGVLRHVAGVDVVQWGADATDVSIRGYNQAYAARTLVLIDGRQVYADYYGFIPWSTLPVELGAIRQIEVVKGPNTALFGFNAAGGVINIITYNPRYDDTNSLSFRAGSQSLVDLSGVGTFRIGADSALRISGSYRTDGDFESRVPLLRPGASHLGNNHSAVDASAVFGFEQMEVVLELSHTHAKLTENSPNYVLQQSMYDTNSAELRLAADTSYGLLHLKAYSNWIDWNGSPEPTLGQFSLHNHVVVLDADDVISIGTDHTLRLAASYRHNTVNTTPIRGGEVYFDLLSTSAMWVWDIAPGLSLTNAVRLDHLMLNRSGFLPSWFPMTNADWERSLDEVSFNSGLVWNASHEDTVRLIASRGVQLPNLVELGALYMSAGGLTVMGSPNVNPTTVTNFEIAWDRAVPELAAKLQLSAFYQDTREISSVGGGGFLTSAGMIATPANIGSSKASGIELTAKGKFWGTWHWSIGYRWMTVKDDFIPAAQGGIDFVDFEHTVPKDLLKLGLGWASGPWEADVYLHAQSQTQGLRSATLSTVPVEIGAFSSADARIAYQITDWATLALSGSNLLQARQIQTAGPPVERQWFVTLTLQN